MPWVRAPWVKYRTKILLQWGVDELNQPEVTTILLIWDLIIIQGNVENRIWYENTKPQAIVYWICQAFSVTPRLAHHHVIDHGIDHHWIRVDFHWDQSDQVLRWDQKITHYQTQWLIHRISVITIFRSTPQSVVQKNLSWQSKNLLDIPAFLLLIIILRPSVQQFGPDCLENTLSDQKSIFYDDFHPTAQSTFNK